MVLQLKLAVVASSYLRTDSDAAADAHAKSSGDVGMSFAQFKMLRESGALNNEINKAVSDKAADKKQKKVIQTGSYAGMTKAEARVEKARRRQERAGDAAKA